MSRNVLKYETLSAELRGAGLRATPQRVAILKAIAHDETHPTAQEIFLRLRGEFPSMSFATVYNTLAALTRSGRVHVVDVGGGAMRYDPNVGRHDHAICDRCGAVRDVMRGRTRSAGAGLPRGFRVSRVNTIYRGTCSSCRSGSKQTNEETHG